MQEEEYAYILTLTRKSVHWIYLNFARKKTEVCATQIKVNNYFITILCIYRSPSADFDQFLEQLDMMLKYSYKPSTGFILCRDLNVIFLLDSNNTFQLRLLLQSYNMFYTVNFPTGTSTRTAIDNIFIDFCRIKSFKVYPIVNGLSDRGPISCHAQHP
jgi:hypothetical protein